MCRCISELWLRAFLKLNSKAAPSLSASALSIYHNYSELNNSLTSFFHFSLSLYRDISSITSVWKLFINLSSSASLSLPPICLFSSSDTAAAASPPAYITQKKIHPWRSLHQFMHTNTFVTSAFFIIAALIPALLSVPCVGLCGYQQSFESHTHQALMPLQQVEVGGSCVLFGHKSRFRDCGV